MRSRPSRRDRYRSACARARLRPARTRAGFSRRTPRAGSGRGAAAPAPLPARPSAGPVIRSAAGSLWLRAVPPRRCSRSPRPANGRAGNSATSPGPRRWPAGRPGIRRSDTSRPAAGAPNGRGPADRSRRRERPGQQRRQRTERARIVQPAMHGQQRRQGRVAPALRGQGQLRQFDRELTRRHARFRWRRRDPRFDQRSAAG